MHPYCITNVLFLIATLITLVLSASLPLDAAHSAVAFEKYQMQPATFKGEIGDHSYELNGTAETVWAQLKEIYPEIELKEHDSLGLETRAMEKRNKILPPLCIPVSGWPWVGATPSAIQDGISYLKNLNTRINIDAHACSRISCSYSSAIFLCNDNDVTISPASPYLATYAQDLNHLMDLCRSGKKAGGQLFDTDRYNIIMRQDDC
ncbi:uncharacterized protein K444DRAFT_663547 [Hyaloscypha bicolor E]|uniref:Uncharacterized protein n=1 Tax=Hyaloscypha bicolor E TaxID=1095630 RepID=A0A2J6TAC6_9HELO|nr:uncharacterized protein K444DRAFT_663547 [Hyaloscypha bicolor E]PMD59977.1 hypothetical protein K444DRAFT_663547 [Hyaloscypha bicolor E]